MTLTEAASRLGIDPATLRQQIAKGRLRAEKHGRDWWVDPAEVERYGQDRGRGRFRPCESCGGTPAVHNVNRPDHVGHEYR